MKTIIHSLLIACFLAGSMAPASIPTDGLKAKMDQLLTPLQSAEAYKTFLKEHQIQFVKVDEQNPLPPVAVDKKELVVDGETYHLGMGYRSIYINAPVKLVVGLAGDPKFFQSLYGLDKSAVIEPVNEDGSFKARIFKLVPGVETQDYTLQYTSHWEDGVWIQRAKMVKDEKNFALRDNIKFIEASGSGTIFRELSLFYPQRWWARLFEGTVRKITSRELMKLNVAFKCAAEKVNQGQPMSDELAKSCQKEASK